MLGSVRVKPGVGGVTRYLLNGLTVQGIGCSRAAIACGVLCVLGHAALSGGVSRPRRGEDECGGAERCWCTDLCGKVGRVEARSCFWS